MFDHDSDKARASGFSLDAYNHMRHNDYFSSGDGFGSIAPSQLARIPDDMSRMDSHAMDWTPTPTGNGSHFRNADTFNDQEDLIDFDEIPQAQPQVSGVGRLVAQFEHKDYVPPLPPRPITNTAPSPAETDPSMSNSSFSSYFSSLTSATHANHAASPVGSPVDSHYGCFGDVLSSITSPHHVNSIESGSPLLNFASFPHARIASPHVSAVRSHVVSGMPQFPDERTRTPFGGETKTLMNTETMDTTDSHMFGDVERNILTFLKSDLEGSHRQQSLQSTRQEPLQIRQEPLQIRQEPLQIRQEPLQIRQELLQIRQETLQSRHGTLQSRHGTPHASQQVNFAAAQPVHRQPNQQLSSRDQPLTSPSPQLNQSGQSDQPTKPPQHIQTTQPTHSSQSVEPAQQLTRQPSRQGSRQTTQSQKKPFQDGFGSSTTSGTPGFSVWRPPSSPAVKQEPPPDSPMMFSKNLFEKPPVPPKPKPIQETHQITLDFTSTAKGKAKAAVKPPKPPKPPRSRLQPPPPPPRPRLDTANLLASPSTEKAPQTPATPATPSTTADVTSPGSLTLRQAVSALRGHGLRPGRELVPAEVWEQHKSTIRSLYLDDRKPLKEVMAIMAEKYSFQATPKMYKTRFSQWGFVKNNTEDEVKRLLSMKFQRDAEGKISEFVRNGRVVNLGTYLKRKGVTEYDLIDFEQPADLPAHIRCRTPTPPPPPIYFHSPELVRAQEILVGNIRKAFLQCRQFENDVGTQVSWTVVQTWGAWSSEILLEANFFFEALDTDTGGQALMRAFKQLEEDLKTLSPLGIFELLTGMANRDLGLVASLCKYLAAHATTNLDRNHPMRAIFGCLYDVQQNHGAAVLSELLWGCSPLFANELEAIYGRRHPYVVRAWLDLAYFNNHVNFDRLQKIALELRAVQAQLEQKQGETDPEVLVVRYAVLQLLYATEPKSDNTKHATTELWATLKSIKVLCRIRDAKSNAYCYHSPVRLSPWTKRCRRRYDAAVAIFEDHLGVKLHPYFEEDLHTTLHELDSLDSWATALEQSSSKFDVLFLRQQGVKYPRWHLTAPIRRDTRVRLSYGASVSASDLIGKQMLERTVDDKGNAVAIYEPTLASYIVNSDRVATPIYPSDAATIVSLLDLHPVRPGEEDKDEYDEGQPDDGPFEVFEAGTGMGSLSLHIARALHAANPPVPAPVRHMLRAGPLARNVASGAGGMLELSADDAAQLAAYKASRRAVLKTLDRSGKHTRAAYKLVRGFRRAQYLADIDFHVGGLADYVAARLAASGGRPVFARAVLDLPAAHEDAVAAALVPALHDNAVLVLFCPSISQVAEFQAWALGSGAPLRLEKVLEMPTTSTADGVRDGGCGGRHWDVKIIKPKPVRTEEEEEEGTGEDAACDGPATESEPVVVMRPKVGGRVAGGGFVAVYRKWPAGTNHQQPEEPEADLEAEA